MKTPYVGRALLAAMCFAVSGLATGSSPGIFRAYLSSAGNDANPCTLFAPCRLLPAGLAAVVDGGRITLLDSANYNTAPVNIAKSVTIDANPGGSASVVAIGGDAIYINAMNVEVTLRNLVILNFGGGTNGIEFALGHHLGIENCEFSNMSNSGINVTAVAGNVTVKNSEFRKNNIGFLAVGTAQATLEGVSLVENNTGIALGDGAVATVVNSTIADNSIGGSSNNTGAGTTSLVIRSSVLNGNGIALIPYAGAGGISAITVDSNAITNSGVAFFFAASSGTTVIYTRSNNTLVNNGQTVIGGNLTPFGGT